MTQTQTILLINASARTDGSDSRKLGGELVAQLAERHGNTNGAAATIIERDLAVTPVPQVTEAWVQANFTPTEDRTAEQTHVLKQSDELIAELQAADIVIIASPMYNFSIPAALKAYIDQIARARVTFKYTENGPVGLLENKKAHLVLTSGGVTMNSPADFATDYLKFILGFVGITDVTSVDAMGLMKDADAQLAAARTKIAELAA